MPAHTDKGKFFVTPVPTSREAESSGIFAPPGRDSVSATGGSSTFAPAPKTDL